VKRASSPRKEKRRQERKKLEETPVETVHEEGKKFKRENRHSK